MLKEPGGVTVATLSAGSRVVPGRVSGEYVEVTLRGWIFSASTKPDTREGFELSTTTNENIRTEPDGAVLARTASGTLLDRVSRRGGWTQVRRSGWVQRTLLRPSTIAAAKPSSKPDSAKPKPTVAAQAPAPKDTLPARVPAASGGAPAGRVRVRAGALLSRAPDGSALGSLSAPAEASVEGRTGDWVNVHVNAWVKRGDIDGPLSPPPAITAAMLRDNPDRYVGQSVEWRVQFLAHQHADELRPEMPSGRPYLLARGPLPESGFVYVLLTREQAEQLQGLQPLDELVLTVTVRAARTRYLATPVVELVRVESGK